MVSLLLLARPATCKTKKARRRASVGADGRQQRVTSLCHGDGDCTAWAQVAMAGAEELQKATAAIRQGRVSADGYVLVQTAVDGQLTAIPLLLVTIKRYIDSRPHAPELFNMIAALLEAGASPNVTDHLGQSALSLAMSGVAADRNDLDLWKLVLNRDPHVGVPTECDRDDLSDCGEEDCRMHCLPLFSLWVHVAVRRNMWATLMLTLKGALSHNMLSVFTESQSQALGHLARSSSFVPWMQNVRRLQAAEARGELGAGSQTAWDGYGAEDEDTDVGDDGDEEEDGEDGDEDEDEDEEGYEGEEGHEATHDIAASEAKDPSAAAGRLPRLTSADLNHVPYPIFERITGELFGALLGEIEALPGFSIRQARA